MKPGLLLASGLFFGGTTIPIPPLLAADPPALGAVYNLSLVTDNAPDLTDIASFLHSITSQYTHPQEQAIAVWRWSQQLRKQTTNPMEDGHYVLDPIRLFNSYGYCNCGIISGVNNALWLNLGWKVHYVQLGDHTVSECSWDGGKSWHMFDSSMSFYCFNDHGEVASVREIQTHPRFYLENFAPECGTNPVGGPDDHQGWRCASDRPVEYQRTLANGFDSFKPPNDIQEANLHAQWGHRYVLNLRPNEHYTRHFSPLPNGGPRTFRPVSNQKDVDTDQRIRANGSWHYAPNLRDPRTRDFVHSDSGVTWTTNGVHGPGTVTFKVSAANVVTSARLSLQATSASLAISRDTGIHWIPVDLVDGTADHLAPAAGVTEFLVKVDLTGPDALLAALVIDTLTQLNRAALPRLSRGVNRVQLRLGQQTETIQFQPSIIAGRHRDTAHAIAGIDVESDPGFYKPTLRPDKAGTPCFVTWKIETPTPITDLVYGGSVCVKSAQDRVALLHSWDDRSYTPDFQKNHGTSPYDLMVNASVDSVPPGTKAAYLRYEFETARYPKHYAGPGIQTATLTVHHRPRNPSSLPVDVTYCWIEHRKSGDVERQHTERVSSSAFEYAINVGGFRDPTMKWVRVNLAGHGPEGDSVGLGYSDGQDVGAAAEPPWIRYLWGTNLARGRSYTLEGMSDPRNPDGGHDLTDGIIAPPDTYVSARYMPTHVMFARNTSPVITLDLGKVSTLAAVRVHAGQEEGFHLTFPDEILVETSDDGEHFAAAGSAPFDQVFDPPADYVPWELDASSRFDHLPAGGRLAYAYRVLFERPTAARFVRVKCRHRENWGMLLSEVQVFDTFKAERNRPPLVALPKLPAPAEAL